MIRRFKAILEYDGSGFVGWQIQPNGASIQAECERALAVLNRAPVKVVAAGRTDAGVHALGQTISFDLHTEIEPRRLLHGFNALVDDRISMCHAEEAPDDFDAQRRALSKHYRYTILNRDARSPHLARSAWHVREALNVDAMREAASYLIGEHDFSAFKAADSCAKTSVRKVLDIRIEKEQYLLVLDIKGQGFLKHMVRNMAGTLVDVGTGKREARWAREVLEGCDRTAAGRTAPAHGLCLVRVDYADDRNAVTNDTEGESRSF